MAFPGMPLMKIPAQAGIFFEYLARGNDEGN